MSEVFRLPPEPPVGTTVRPEPDNNRRVSEPNMVHSWSGLLTSYRSGLVVVVPDPHPTPWTTDEYGQVCDATGKVMFIVDSDPVTQTAQRVVDAVNKATEP